MSDSDVDYASEVRRFGGSFPFLTEHGGRKNLRHDFKFATRDVKTDGRGNIVHKPLHRSKPCFGRPERAVRGCLDRGKPYGPLNEFGEQERGTTVCDRCPIMSACLHVAEERVSSCARIESALDLWWTECEKSLGSVGLNACYVGRLGKLWRHFLSAIEDFGGWSSIDSELIRLDDLRRREEANRKRRERTATKRREEKLKRDFGAEPLSDGFLRNLENERKRRSTQLQTFRSHDAAPLWVRKLPTESCERISNVWWALQILRREGRRLTGVEVVKLLQAEGRDQGKNLKTLHARVCEDLKRRIPPLEDDLGNGPIWPQWNG